jgi:hypothetical protein
VESTIDYFDSTTTPQQLHNNFTTVFLSRYGLVEVWWSPVESIKTTSVVRHIDESYFCTSII